MADAAEDLTPEDLAMLSLDEPSEDVRTPHQDEQAELAVVTAVIDPGDSGLIDKVAHILRADHFFSVRNARFYDAALALRDAGRPVTFSAMKAWMMDHKTWARDDWEYLRKIDEAPVDFHIEDNARRIIAQHRMESIVRACEKTIREAVAFAGEPKEFAAKFEARSLAVTELAQENQNTLRVLSMKNLFESIATKVIEDTPVERCTFGIQELDDDLGGLPPESITIVGADTNWGKTNVAVFLADENLKLRKRVLIVTFEDTETIYARRIAARRASINAARLRDQTLHDDELERLFAITSEATAEPVFLRAIGASAEAAAAMLRRLLERHGFHLVLIDYLQKARLARRVEDRKREVADVAGIFGDVIKNGHASGVIFSQLRRMSREEKRPTKHHLKESGDVENGAENVLLGYRKGQHYRLRADKGKDGNKNEYELIWDANACCFRGGHVVEDEPEPATPARRSRWSPKTKPNGEPAEAG